jgi:hypothetical protein
VQLLGAVAPTKLDNEKSARGVAVPGAPVRAPQPQAAVNKVTK